jgi:hypothetical protein
MDCPQPRQARTHHVAGGDGMTLEVVPAHHAA